MPKFVKACKQSRFIPIGHPPLGLSGLLWSISSERKTARANQSGPSTLRPFCAIIAIPRAGSLSKGLEAIRVEMALGTVSVVWPHHVRHYRRCSGSEIEVISQVEDPRDLNDRVHARGRFSVIWKRRQVPPSFASTTHVALVGH